MYKGRVIFLIILLLIIILSFVVFNSKVFSYSGQPTHWNLTKEIIRLYNLAYDPDITDEKVKWILQGSLDEDVLPRPAFHLYDPIYNRAPFGAYTARQWAINSDIQGSTLRKFANLFLNLFGTSEFKQHGDYSWAANVNRFAKNQDQYAWYGLGHILHLIEDMTVPAHSRNDHHVFGDPYESWAQANTKDEDYIYAEKLYRDGYWPVDLDNLSQAMDNLARYSNKYFFSKDTILDKDYNYPKIIREQPEDYGFVSQRWYAWGEDENWKLYRLTEFTKDLLYNKKIYKIEDEDDKLNSDYFSRLAPRAIQYGAGVIKLFLDEGNWEKERLAQQKNPSQMAQVVEPSGSLDQGTNGNIPAPLPQPKPMRFPVAADVIKPIEPPLDVPLETPQPAANSENMQAGEGVNKGNEQGDNQRESEGNQGETQNTDNGSIVIQAPFYSGGGGTNYTPESQNNPPPPPAQPSPPASSPHLVINEVQVRNNEFVELYNPTESAIDLASYSFCYFSSNRDWNDPHRNQPFPVNASISASGYYLIGLEGYPTSSGNPDADWQVYDSQQLNNSDGSIVIFSTEIIASTTVDEAKTAAVDVVAWGNVDFIKEGISFQTTLGQDKSMQRINHTDIDDNNTDFEYKTIPSPTNSNNETRTLGTIIGDHTIISENTTWTIAGSPYYVESNAGQWPIVNDGFTLIVEPGAIIMPQNPYYTFLEIRGTLKAEGTASDKIVFTSKNDSDYGGSGGAAVGDWLNIIFTSTSDDSSFKNVIFRYGGKTIGFNNTETEMVKVDGGSITMENVTMEKSKTRGLHLINSNSLIKNSTFKDSKLGILIEGALDTSTIDNCSFENNSEFGLQIITQAMPIISNNQFVNNGQIGTDTRYDSQGAIALHSSCPQFSSNTFTNNLLNGVLLHGEFILYQDCEWQEGPYIILTSGHTPIIDENKTLTIKPDTIIKFQGSNPSLLVKGTIKAEAASGSEIVFTSLKDDNFGGDTNNDGVTIPANGDWKYIEFTSISIGSIFDHVIMRYGTGVPPIIVDPSASVDIKDVIE